jgi:hypothetical protein
MNFQPCNRQSEQNTTLDIQKSTVYNTQQMFIIISHKYHYHHLQISVTVTLPHIKAPLLRNINAPPTPLRVVGNCSEPWRQCGANLLLLLLHYSNTKKRGLQDETSTSTCHMNHQDNSALCFL